MPNAFDSVVVGRSLTGCLCALELRARGQSVGLFEYHADSEHLQRVIRVPPTPLNGAPVSGPEFAERLRQRIADVGIVEGHDWACEIEQAHQRQLRVALFGNDGSVATTHVVFAPAGCEIGAPDLGAGAFYGVGVSTDAWSDMTFATRDDESGEVRPFFLGATVAVLGAGLRAAEESLICARAGVKKVILLCEKAVPDFHDLHDDVARCANIEVRSGVRIVSLEKDDSRLAAIRCVDSNGIESVLDPKWLFLARGVECDWSAFGGAPTRRSAGVVLAGLAAGIPYDDYAALVADAQRAATVVTSE